MKITNNRIDPRHLRAEAISIQVMLPSFDGAEDAVVVQTKTLDVSSTGLKVQTDQFLPSGYIFDICIQLKDYPKKFLLTAEIKWCRKITDDVDNFHAGLEVQKALGTDYRHWSSFFDNV